MRLYAALLQRLQPLPERQNQRIVKRSVCQFPQRLHTGVIARRLDAIGQKHDLFQRGHAGTGCRMPADGITHGIGCPEACPCKRRSGCRMQQISAFCLNRIDNDRVRAVLTEEAAAAAGQSVGLSLRVGDPPKRDPKENLQNLLAFASKHENITIK